MIYEKYKSVAEFQAWIEAIKSLDQFYWEKEPREWDAFACECWAHELKIGRMKEQVILQALKDRELEHFLHERDISTVS